MKKLFITALFLFSISLTAQDIIFAISQYEVPRKDMNSFLELNDNYYGDIEFKSGGVVIDWIRIGNGEFNVRVGRYGDCLLYTSPSPRDKRQSRLPSSA